METAQTADYALRVLLELDRLDNQAVSELAANLSVSRSVLQRIVVTLHNRALLLKGHDGRFSLGPGLIRLARNLPHELAALARPSIRELSELVKEMVVLAVPDGDEAVVVARRSGSDSPLRIEYELGFRHSLSRGASGLAILAFQDDADPSRLRPPIPRSTIDVVRAQGYARTTGELRDHMVGIAVPIISPTHGVVGSLAFIAPSVRSERLDGAVDDLIQTAEQIAAAYESEYGIQIQREAASRGGN